MVAINSNNTSINSMIKLIEILRKKTLTLTLTLPDHLITR